ncbi:MAG: TonB-dependent receptor SusC [Candidatus Ordinivivax streblomastigis]|uniref:TonB-dependent receptor SusC n=1 Tax=Candidatus Ordinivivax streblomastigis TaxID=2540710 RepID=A0A5M8NY48_9BACT|nr:MAG: TonB-dependent receptor SusC [Candidatus Ordinivivax streblomastigis]
MKDKRKGFNWDTLRKLLLLALCICSCTLSLFAQRNVTVTGILTDENSETMPGVSILVQGSTRGVITDVDGSFKIDVKPDDALIVSFLGYETQTIKVGGRQKINVQLQPKANELDEVTVVAFGKQKKESMISSIQTVNANELRVPSSNLTTAFAGRIAGMISYQTSGEPGYDNASFFIRGVTTFGAGKVDPLILIDNVEVSTSDLAKYHPDDIASFSILKDATATALYGARGANGVILVTTKEGREGKAKVSFRLENSWSSPTSTVEMADPITYMELANEAVSTRNPLAPTPYSRRKIESTMDPNRNQYVYPAVDWMDMLTKNTAVNQRANLSISGGGEIARYYIAGSFTQDNGILKVDKRNNFNTNVNYKKYLIRSNININLTKTTEAIIRVHGSFDDYAGPITGGSDMYKRILQVSPVRFPAYYEPDALYSQSAHILFGGFQSDRYLNPYAELVKGYKEESKSVMMAQLELKQDFGKWVNGLTGRLLGNTTRNAAFDLNRSYSPFYYEVGNYDRFADIYTLRELNPTTGTEDIRYNFGDKTVNSSFYGEVSIAYNRTFSEQHTVSGMLVGTIRNYMTANAGTLAASLPTRNQGIAGRFTYGYDNRYLTEFNFGYNGSEKFDKGHRWGFFPSFGVGWNVSNESFWTGALKDTVSKLKIRGTYGLAGNDDISQTRFFYISEVILGGGGGYSTGLNFDGTSRNGVRINNYANPNIGWEKSYKSNLGLELGLFQGKIEIQADFFQEHRTNILQSRADIPSEIGLWNTPQVNVGEANGKGIDVSVDYNHNINKNAWLVGRANFTYARSTYQYYEEPDYEMLETPWRSRKGNAVSQQWGYVAERLFIDEEDRLASARQDFGEYMAGDIKYKDMNGDNVINEMDLVPIGHPTTPEINYGFGLSAGYKTFDISIFFQGSARSSFWIDAAAMSPFYSRVPSGQTQIYETGLAKFIADDHWSELSQNPNAGWPRLSDKLIANNNQRSTWFMQNSSFLRLKSAEIGYSLPGKWASRVRLESCRFYLSGTNLLLLSKFKLWDVEMGGNGLNYPLQRVINLGVNLSF